MHTSARAAASPQGGPGAATAWWVNPPSNSAGVQRAAPDRRQLIVPVRGKAVAPASANPELGRDQRRLNAGAARPHRKTITHQLP